MMGVGTGWIERAGHLFRASAVAAVLAALSMTSAIAADKIIVTGVVTTGALNGVYVGMAKGFFAEEGIEVEVLKAAASTAVAPAVASGSADLAIGGPSASFFNIAGNGDFYIIGGATYSKAGYTQTIIVANIDAYNKGFKGAADLPGKTIAFSSLGSLAQYYLYATAEKYKFAFDSVKTPALGSDANALAAVKAKSVDGAMIGSIALAIPLEASGDAKIIVRTAEETPALSNIIYTSSKLLTTRRDQLTRFMRAYLKAAALVSSTFDKRDAQGALVRNAQSNELLDIIAKALDQPVDAVLGGLVYVIPDAMIDPTDVTKQLAAWKKLGVVDAKVDETKLVDLSILQAAAKK